MVDGAASGAVTGVVSPRAVSSPKQSRAAKAADVLFSFLNVLHCGTVSFVTLCVICAHDIAIYIALHLKADFGGIVPNFLRALI